MTLTQFLKSVARSHWVTFHGIKNLYVRKGPKYINNQFYEQVLDIANVEVDQPGTGAFTEMLKFLDSHWNGPIYIENVLGGINGRLAQYLLRKGFKLVRIPGNNDKLMSSFVKWD